MADQETSNPKPEITSSESSLPDPIAVSSIASIKDLIKVVTGKDIDETDRTADYGFAEKLPFPFSAIVGQQEMKLALVLSLINPLIGGVLLIGPRGTGKTTSVRSLIPLLPMVEKSSCFYGCTEDDLLSGGTDAVCEDCAQKYARNEPLTHLEPTRLVELPLNATIDDVIGQLDDNLSNNHPMRFKRGILSRADKNILLVDEINLLQNEILDAILDASAYGSYTVRRSSLSATLKSRFSMVGTMNPQEGVLRPQILDRFGLRVFARSLSSVDERLLAYQRTQIYKSYPHHIIAEFEEETTKMAADIENAQHLVRQMEIPNPIAKLGISLITQLKIPSIRAEISLFEAAKAHAAADNRDKVTKDDLQAVAIIALRMRNSHSKMNDDASLEEEDQKIKTAMQEIFN
ncbi:MAG: ATP-binding protein [Anaerolineaceae bacterium]|nr:ATP-binding protein [Anaerolineaceae bacterium]